MMGEGDGGMLGSHDMFPVVASARLLAILQPVPSGTNKEFPRVQQCVSTYPRKKFPEFPRDDRKGLRGTRNRDLKKGRLSKVEGLHG